ncbi:alanine transaminase [[Emmonsia] crescens]|uniref:Alanine transaminase n=1 Tax=[Emmonsia] crescens TaxID=73230 RepID=A0A0G2HQG0_9EURO|nr:alanine transaminase [Emmonsia crescens UAMH 3008]
MLKNIYKFISIMLCAPVTGQCLLKMMNNLPVEGDSSYELYQKEYNSIHDGLYEHTEALYRAFQQMKGPEWGHVSLSNHKLLTINFPLKVIKAATVTNHQSDKFYTLHLLDVTGVCVVPGSGFGQKEGMLHFHITFLAHGTV